MGLQLQLCKVNVVSPCMGEVSGVIKVEIQVCFSPVGKSSEQFIFPLTDHL